MLKSQSTAHDGRESSLAQGFGWFSIGLGFAEIFAPRSLAKSIGVKPRPTLFRLLGVREIVSGSGILTERRPKKWITLPASVIHSSAQSVSFIYV